MSYYINLSILSNNPNSLRRTERQKKLSAETRRILSLCEGRPVTDDNIAREKSGRPFFLNRQAQCLNTDFSISHSGALAAVSLVSGKSARTGCDVELVRPRAGAGKIAAAYFSGPERDYIEAAGGFDPARFYQIWTLKECFIKLRGLSVFDMANVPSFVSGEDPCSWRFEFASSGVSSILFNLYELSGSAGERYMLAAAIEGTETEQPQIRWFSGGALDCSSIANINAAHSPAETVRPKI